MATLGIIFAVLLLILQGLFGPSTQAPASVIATGYLAVDLPLVGDHSTSSAASISDPGLIVGFAQSADSQSAVRWDQGTISTLPSLGGASNMALAVNTAGEIAGVSGQKDGGWLPVRWSGDDLMELEILPGLNECIVLAINDVGSSTGYCYPGGQGDYMATFRPALWEGEKVAQLALPAGDTWGFANGINDAGRIVGATGNAGDDSMRAVTWTDGISTELSGASAGMPTWARAVNAGGSVIGWSENRNGSKVASIWTGGALQTLGALPDDISSTAMSIDNSNRVVGYSTSSDGHDRAFLWTDGQMFELPQLAGSTGSAAFDINNLGQVVGTTDFADGSSRATLWSTTTPDWITSSPATPAITIDEDAGAFVVNIEMVDLAFIEPEIVVPADTEIVVRLTNNGALPHSFSISALSVSSGEIQSGETATLTFNFGSPGVYGFFCAIPGHREAGMIGTLTVLEAGESALHEDPSAEETPTS